MYAFTTTLRQHSLICAFVCCLFYAIPSQSTKIFKCTNASGEVEYTQKPSSKCRDSKVKVYSGKADSNAEEKLKKYREQTTEDAEEKRLDDRKLADREKQEQEKKEYCDDLKANIQRLRSTPRVFQTDEQGNRNLLTNEQRLERIEEDKLNLKKNCS